MRCVACAAEMLVVLAMPDQSMIVSGKELCTFECPRCHSQRKQFVFTRNIEQLSSERMLLPSASSTWRPAINTLLVAAQRAWLRAVAMLQLKFSSLLVAVARSRASQASIALVARLMASWRPTASPERGRTPEG